MAQITQIIDRESGVVLVKGAMIVIPLMGDSVRVNTRMYVVTDTVYDFQNVEGCSELTVKIFVTTTDA